MKIKTFIASTSKLLSKFIHDACTQRDMDVVSMGSEQHLLDELRSASPDLVFLQASIIEESHDNLIAQMKADEQLSRAYIVVFASRPEGSEFAYKIGADAFLPIPFKNEQFEQILRLILNLPKQILVVSKTDALFTTVREVGVMFEFNVIWAKSAEEAVKLAGEQFPDLILTDYELPQRNGAALSALIKHSHLLGHIPVVIMAKSNDATIVEECFEAGSNDVFLYPFDTQKHTAVISGIVKPPKRGRKFVALVVDDSITVRHVISKMFKQLGFLVFTAADGKEGLELALQQRPDIITSDYDMPVMDGWEFCARLRENEEVNGIPVVMISSRAGITDKRKAQSLGVSAYLTKPFRSEDLENIVKVLVLQAQRKKREKTLEKYAAPEVSKRGAEGGNNLFTEERTVTILSSNICEFGKKFDWLGMVRVAELLNTYFKSMTDIIVERKGKIDSFIGDAILVRFDSGDEVGDALNAIDTAVGMLEYLDDYNSRSEDEIEIRIGIHTDRVIIGNFGSPEHRLVYSMLGEGVSIAKSLQRATAPNSCLMSNETYKLVHDSVGDLAAFSVPYRNSGRDIEAYKL